MKPNVPSCSSGEGNTKTSPLPKINPAKNWVFTFNNYTKEDIDYICSRCSKFCKKWIFQEETGETGTPHLQGYIEFITKHRPMSVFETNKIHWEKMRGTKQDCISYCSKLDTRTGQIFTNIKFPKPLKSLPCENHKFPWQQKVCDILQKEPDDRTIYWIVGQHGGEGKTTFCKWIYRNYPNVIVTGGKSADMKNSVIEYQKTNDILPEIVLINIPRSFNSDYLSYPGIESVKDMFFYSGKYEGGMVDGNEPHVFVFANEYPDYDKMSPDRWIIFDTTDV